ncbi:MAG: Flp pilus assembly complex ATPase component TadA [Alphaproteobacteria bacterium]|nr:Flp pilus assembly complex ATPase component TadA [Alphaproteobacteria bacterium]
MSATLGDLPFIDLYVRLDQPDQAYYRSKERSQSMISQPVPGDYQLSIDRFMAAVNERLKEHSDGALESEGVRVRLSKQKMSDNSFWVCARRINTEIPDITKLGLQQNILDHMIGLGKRDGLIVISGATGQGKTTTAVGLLGYYLNNYGGTAVTIEDPCEFMLAGHHNKGGHCFQVEVEKDEDWAICLKRALRWAPRYIYVGEVRTPKAAEQLLRAASTGHLVITTVHAGAIEEALMGIIFLAEQSMGSGVHSMLAACLTGLVNQTIRDTGPMLKYLFTEENSPGDPVRALIRDNKIGMLSTYIDRVAARLKNPAPGGAFPPAAIPGLPGVKKT